MGAATDARFRAFDQKTGKELWAGQVDRTAAAIPMTYQGRNGKQYVAITANRYADRFRAAVTKEYRPHYRQRVFPKCLYTDLYN